MVLPEIARIYYTEQKASPHTLPSRERKANFVYSCTYLYNYVLQYTVLALKTMTKKSLPKNLPFFVSFIKKTKKKKWFFSLPSRLQTYYISTKTKKKNLLHFQDWSPSTSKTHNCHDDIRIRKRINPFYYYYNMLHTERDSFILLVLVFP